MDDEDDEDVSLTIISVHQQTFDEYKTLQDWVDLCSYPKLKCQICKRNGYSLYRKNDIYCCKTCNEERYKKIESF